MNISIQKAGENVLSGATTDDWLVWFANKKLELGKDNVISAMSPSEAALLYAEKKNNKGWNTLRVATVLETAIAKLLTKDEDDDKFQAAMLDISDEYVVFVGV